MRMGLVGLALFVLGGCVQEPDLHEQGAVKKPSPQMQKQLKESSRIQDPSDGVIEKPTTPDQQSASEENR